MRTRLALAAIGTATVATLATVPATAHAADPSPSIIGGGTVSSAPWAAQVYASGSFTCSGTIIASQWVLTARHCLSSSMSVRVGSVTRGSGTAASVTATYAQNDLALLRLGTSISTSYSPLASSDPPVGSTNNIYGWGMTCYSGCSPATQLKTATVQVTGFTTDAYGGRAIRSTRINGNAWKGDSGGPEFYNGLQVGVASTADGQSIQNYGSVATNRSWIRSVSGV
ncbi:S1 family peptidase [Planosporangium sp. 12N6]|uniref:S1 family peptidase n=1 Tax=Planosporangium spinosum TaxID=3402278 RepID=UPI003CF56CAC